MRRFHPIFFLLSLGFHALQAQFVSHGPVIGGLTSSSARMYVRTHQAQNFVVELSLSANFTPVSHTVNAATQAARDSSIILEISGLQPNTLYFYRLQFTGQTELRKGSFSTFPLPNAVGHYVIATGSCQETPNMKVFDRLAELKPDIFIHTGDYTYPSYQLDNTYPSQYPKVEESWRRRYEEDRMEEMLLNVPIDYVPDDDDNFDGDCNGFRVRLDWQLDSQSQYISYAFERDTVLPISRYNVLKGYRSFFPGYALVDSMQAFYHQFTLGNCDFFVLDTRSEASCIDEPFVFNSNDSTWSYQPAPGYNIISPNQMQWLKNALLQSTATWKFIVGGVPFNRNNRILLGAGMDLQQAAFPLGSNTFVGMKLAASMAGYWAGHPQQQDELLDFLQANQLKDVVFLSGDTHTNALDDGTNAGMPELNASGLSVVEGDKQLLYYLNAFGPLLGYPAIKDSVWNKGGTGLSNEDYKNGFGTVEVFGNDSLKICCIDEDGLPFACMTLHHSSVQSLSPDAAKKAIELHIVPNPASEQVRVTVLGLTGLDKSAVLVLTDMAGRELGTYPYVSPQTTLEVGHLPKGVYTLSYEGALGRATKLLRVGQ